jgi:hypothetical protein
MAVNFTNVRLYMVFHRKFLSKIFHFNFQWIFLAKVCLPIFIQKLIFDRAWLDKKNISKKIWSLSLSHTHTYTLHTHTYTLHTHTLHTHTHIHTTHIHILYTHTHTHPHTYTHTFTYTYTNKKKIEKMKRKEFLFVSGPDNKGK